MGRPRPLGIVSPGLGVLSVAMGARLGPALALRGSVILHDSSLLAITQSGLPPCRPVVAPRAPLHGSPFGASSASFGIRPP